MLQLPLYVLAGGEAARDRRRQRRGRVRVPDAPGRVQDGRVDSPTSSPPATPTCSRCSTRSSRAARRGDFIIAPSRRAPATTAPFNGICVGARGDYAERKDGDERLAPARDRDPERPVTERLADQTARERITGDLDANLGVEAGAGTGKTTVLVERVANVLATRHGRRSTSWW